MPSKKKESPFKEILSQVKAPESPAVAPKVAPVKKPATKRSSVNAAAQKPASPSLPTGRRGKSSDPDFTQATLYIRKDTHHEIKRRLLDERNGRDMSDLAEELFSQWLAEKK